jgi:hypothetical protein
MMMTTATKMEPAKPSQAQKPAKLYWERIHSSDLSGYDGEYAFSGFPDLKDRKHFYQVLVHERTVDLPKRLHRFYLTWIDLATDQDIIFGENFTCDEAVSIAEEHWAARRADAS